MSGNSINRIRGLSRQGQWRAASQAMGMNTPAISQAVPFLAHLPGVRGLWTNRDKNKIINGSFQMTLVNKASNTIQWDAENYYNYTNCLRSSSQCYEDNASAALWSCESNVALWNSIPGLTVGAWVRFTSLPAYDQGIIAAWNANTSQSVWRIFIDSSSKEPRFNVSASGTYDTNNNLELGEVPPIDTWCLITARWKASTSINIDAYWDDTKYSAIKTSSIASGLYATGTLWGYLAAFKDASNVYQSLNGDLGISFFYVSYFPEDTMDTIYQVTRKIYKV